MMNRHEQERRNDETFRRLHRLTGKGYVARLAELDSVDDAIYLDHLADGPPLILYSDGTLVCIAKERPINPGDPECDDRIFNEDQNDITRFDHFLAAVRQPTWRERTRPDREKYIYTPGCMILMLAALWLSGEALVWVWRQITA